MGGDFNERFFMENFCYKNLNFDTYNSLTPNWYYKVLR